MSSSQLRPTQTGAWLAPNNRSSPPCLPLNLYTSTYRSSSPLACTHPYNTTSLSAIVAFASFHRHLPFLSTRRAQATARCRRSCDVSWHPAPASSPTSSGACPALPLSPLAACVFGLWAPACSTPASPYAALALCLVCTRQPRARHSCSDDAGRRAGVGFDVDMHGAQDGQ